jgi:hypothetical protein
MSRIKRVMGSCLSIFIVGMAVSATAQALPEWQKEEKPLTETLSFKSHGSTGQFEDGKVHVSWKSVGGAGTIKGTNEIATLSLIFWESEVSGTFSCAVNSPGAKSGEIKTKALTGHIGYLEKAGKIVGALAKPASGTIVAEIEGSCLPGKVTVSGSVVGRVTAELNKPIASVGVSFSLASGAPEYESFEEESERHTLTFSGGLTGGALFECTKEEFELEGGKKVEIKA